MIQQSGSESYRVSDVTSSPAGAWGYEFLMLRFDTADEAVIATGLVPRYFAESDAMLRVLGVAFPEQVSVSLIGDSRLALHMTDSRFGLVYGYLAVQFDKFVFFGSTRGENFNPIADLANYAGLVESCVDDHREEMGSEPSACLPTYDLLPPGFENGFLIDPDYTPPPTPTPSPVPTLTPTPLPTPTPIPYAVYTPDDDGEVLDMEFIGPGAFRLNTRQGSYAIDYRCYGTSTNAQVLAPNGNVAANMTSFGFSAFDVPIGDTYFVYSDCTDGWTFSTGELILYDLGEGRTLRLSDQRSSAVRVNLTPGQYSVAFTCPEPDDETLRVFGPYGFKGGEVPSGGDFDIEIDSNGRFTFVTRCGGDWSIDISPKRRR